jgi:hypothetical protein
LFNKPEPAVKWIVDVNTKGCNCYFTVNDLASSAQFNKKPGKRDIARMTWAHVDIDPLPDETPEHCQERALDHLRTFNPRPSLVIASGGGINALWRLSQPAEVNGHLQDLEGINIAIADALHADHCHNIDRILRYPGTINHPDAKARKGAPARSIEDSLCRTRNLQARSAAAARSGPIEGNRFPSVLSRTTANRCRRLAT